MTYFVDTWYVELQDGTIESVANLATAKYLVAHGLAVRVVDINRTATV